MAARKKLTMVEVRRALRKVRTKLQNGKIDAEHFDMRKILQPRYIMGETCGSVGCIGGYMALELGAKTRQSAGRIMDRAGVLDFGQSGPNNEGRTEGRLNKLFFDFYHVPNITPAKAVKAITRYLDGKEAWPYPKRK